MRKLRRVEFYPVGHLADPRPAINQDCSDALTACNTYEETVVRLVAIPDTARTYVRCFADQFSCLQYRVSLGTGFDIAHLPVGDRRADANPRDRASVVLQRFHAAVVRVATARGWPLDALMDCLPATLAECRLPLVDPGMAPAAVLAATEIVPEFWDVVDRVRSVSDATAADRCAREIHDAGEAAMMTFCVGLANALGHLESNGAWGEGMVWVESRSAKRARAEAAVRSSCHAVMAAGQEEFLRVMSARELLGKHQPAEGQWLELVSTRILELRYGLTSGQLS